MKRHPVRQHYRMVELQRAGMTARREISSAAGELAMPCTPSAMAS
jgi:hypothetical protein